MRRPSARVGPSELSGMTTKLVQETFLSGLRMAFLDVQMGA